MTELLADILASAAVCLLREQPSLSKFTSETNEYEPNLSFHFANTLRRFLFWLDCDFDVSKPNLGNKRPDIIFHKRGIHTLNFLVVEVKRNECDAAEDIKKIRDFWFNKRLSYRLGASVVIGGNRSFSLQLLERGTGKEETRRHKTNFNRLRIAKDPEGRTTLAKLVNRVVTAKQQDVEANTCALELEIDQLVYALYGVTPGRNPNH